MGIRFRREPDFVAEGKWTKLLGICLFQESIVLTTVEIEGIVCIVQEIS